METDQTSRAPRFRVLDAMDAPHRGRILRLRLEAGETPKIDDLRNARLLATAPDGRTETVRVLGFAVFGGRPSDDRLARTGRIDLVVDPDGGGPTVGLRWTVQAEAPSA